MKSPEYWLDRRERKRKREKERGRAEKREREERARERCGERADRSPRKLFINEMAGSVGDDEATGKLHGTGTSSSVIPPNERGRRFSLSLSFCLYICLSLSHSLSPRINRLERKVILGCCCWLLLLLLARLRKVVRSRGLRAGTSVIRHRHE